jgi:hypothetical protein
MNVYINSNATDQCRRSELYKGAIFIYESKLSVRKLCDFARQMIEEVFAPLDPRKVHERLPVEECVRILADLKPRFIHHPRSKELLQEILGEVGCDLDKTYFDVPRMRTAFPSEYLTSGIAYAFHAHRDTWYSAPSCQLNWWLPIYDITADNCMAIHPQYWSKPVRNGSSNYNYYEWNKDNRQTAAKHIKTDTRVQPQAEEPLELDPQIRLVCDVGGVYLFSAAQMHSTVPNSSGMTRFSIDFRTVHLDDVWAQRGAPNVDSACTGTTMNDYLRGTDLSRIPKEAVALYDSNALVTAQR